MKVLLYLTIALCVVSQAYGAPLYTCSSTMLSASTSNCASIINPLIGGNYNYFDLNQLSAFGFNVTLMEAGLSGIFAAISAQPLCSHCQANLKAFYCLNVYPACVTAISGAIGRKPSFPCNDATCTSLATSCTPGVFNPSSPLYNAAYSNPNYSGIPLAFSGITAGFISGAPGLFGLPSNSTACTGQNGINSTVSAVIGEALICPTAFVSANYDTSNAAESCPCMSFPSSGTTTCTQAANAFGQIPAIYGTLNVATVDTAIGGALLGQSSLLPAPCANCIKAATIFACSTGFLQCNATTNAATAFQFPCETVGANFISSCSLQAAYNFATSPYNPTPNATLNGELLAVITQAASLPSSGCAYQPFTPDANCGCVPLAPTDLCYSYISGVSPFLPLATLNAAANAAFTPLSAIFGLFNSAPANCPNCISRITSALCNTVYPSCSGTTTAAAPHCVSSCLTELANCGSASQLCTNAFTGLSNNGSICAPYVSTVASFNATSCPALPIVVQQCATKAAILAADSSCNTYVTSTSIVPLTSLNPLQAQALAGIDSLISVNVSQQVCSNCQVAINELFCNMAYLPCTAYSPLVTGLPITLYLPQWGCPSDLTSEFQDCIPPTASTPAAQAAFLAGFSAGFAINGVSIASSFNTANTTFASMFTPLSVYHINYACFDFHTEVNRSALYQTCPCVTLDNVTLGGCFPYVNYPVSVMLNSPYIAPAVLSDPGLTGLIQFSCPACANKITEFACLAAFPQCLNGITGFYPVHQNVCLNSLETCRAIQFTDPELTALLGLVSAVPGFSITAPNVSTILNACAPFTSVGFFPTNYTILPPCPCSSLPSTSQCAQYVSHPVGNFLANLDTTTRATLEGFALGFDAGFSYTGCPNCKNAVDFTLCNAIYPTCTTSQLAVRGCISDCATNVGFCTDTTTPGICVSLISPAFSNLTTCNPIPYANTHCTTSSTNPKSSIHSSTHSGSSSLMPSFFVFILVALFAKILF